MKKVFILGAGSNAHLSFPTGYELREKIINSNLNILDPVERNRYEKLKKEFFISQNTSIDRFIEKNQQYEEIGKKVIASFISEYENKALELILSNNSKDNWYFYLFNRVLARLNDFDEEITFISFNYDRSLEEYINKAIESTFIEEGRSFETTEDHDRFKGIKERLHKRFKFEYVYGNIGDLKLNPYGKLIKFQDIGPISEKIKLLTNGRVNEEQRKLISETTKSADLIYIIGFGFDPVNMRVVGLVSESQRAQAIFSTCKGIGIVGRNMIFNRLDRSVRYKLQFYRLKKSNVNFLIDLYIDKLDEIHLPSILDRNHNPYDIYGSFRNK